MPAKNTVTKKQSPQKKNSTRTSVRIFWYVLAGGFGTFVLILLLAMLGVFGKLPSLKELENPSILQSSEVYAVDGTLMGKYYLERGNRSNVSYRDISRHVINALVATEDERFYDHAGIDFKSTLRAIFLLGKEGGGSTITQQLAKTLLGQGSKNSVARVIEKIKEYIVAIRLERNFTKEEIVSLYLNAVSFSDNVYGIRNASRTFFQKDPDRLNIEEASLLVGTLKANYSYNPRLFPVASRERRNVVLGQLAKNNYITDAEAARLKLVPIRLNYEKLDENTGYAPYFREVLRDEINTALKGLTNSEGEKYDIYRDGLRIHTTINLKMQDYAEEAVAQQMPVLQKALNRQNNIKKGSVWKGHQNVLDAAMKASDRWRNLKEEGVSDAEIKKTFSVKTPMRIFAWNKDREKDTVMTPMDSIKYHRQMLQTGFMVMDPITGEVKAWVGGIDFKTYKYDHANLRTKRQVGSAIKPFLYSQAMEERGFTPETPVEDVQQSFGKDQLVPSTGKSCTGRTVTMTNALTWSRNCATAYIMKQVGAPQFSSFLERINIPTHVDAYPSIALGACDLSLFEMMWGYTIFPGHGFSTKPYFISRIEDRHGNVIKRFDFSQNRKEAISEITAYKMTRMMEGPVTQGTAAGLMQRLGAKEMGGKTGTTNDNADAWFMGYVPQLLAGTWIGCDDRFIRIESGLGYGGQAARPIWEAFFKKVYADKSLSIDKEAISEITAYKMTRMMEGPVTQGTAAGLMQRLGAKEMGGKTGTTNDNADAWFMGYVPQLLAGTWIGCDDRFIRIESGLGYGGQAARPIWEAFFKKVYADKSLGIDRESTFAKPADLLNEMNSADPLEVNPYAPPPGAEGEDQGVGDANDYGLDTSYQHIGPESKAPIDENGSKTKPTKKPDSTTTKAPKIGTPVEEKKEKKGIFKKIFGKKEEN